MLQNKCRRFYLQQARRTTDMLGEKVTDKVSTDVYMELFIQHIVVVKSSRKDDGSNGGSMMESLGNTTDLFYVLLPQACFSGIIKTVLRVWFQLVKSAR